MAMTRKVFLQRLAGSAGLVAWGGCGGGGSDYSGAAMPSGGGCAATIAANHGHMLSIPAADLDSLVDRTYSIQGSASHDHLVTFSAAQLAALKAGQQVAVTSSVTLNHSHAITEACT